jgi:hypothetical protein
MKRILVFSRDPGGANAVIPLVPALRKSGFDVQLYGKEFALVKYLNAGVEAINIADVIPVITEPTLAAFIAKIFPDFVITGTSANDDTEKMIWKICESTGIPSMAVVDQWCNYGLRFSEFGVNEIETYEACKVHSSLPSKIITLDDFARNEMIADGLPEERIIVCGQPYFESLLTHQVDTEIIEHHCRSIAIEANDFVVVFASEPITTTYGEQEALRYWGYTEKTILDSLVKALEKVAIDFDRQIVLSLRPHPKEGHDHFDNILTQCNRIRWRIDTNSSQWTMMQRANLVCGMSSMFLLESVIVGRPTISVQIGLCRENPFVLARRGATQTVRSDAELEAQLRCVIIAGTLSVPVFDIIPNPVERIVAEVEKTLCQN